LNILTLASSTEWCDTAGCSCPRILHHACERDDQDCTIQRQDTLAVLIILYYSSLLSPRSASSHTGVTCLDSVLSSSLLTSTHRAGTIFLYSRSSQPLPAIPVQFSVGRAAGLSTHSFRVLRVCRFAFGMAMVFRGTNANDSCEWCHYLSCVPTSRWTCIN
jgi:hypothetical protein